MSTNFDASTSGVEHHIAWREMGDAALTPMLFLHGLGGSRISWEPQLAALSSHLRTIAWDLPGYGASRPLESMTFPALADSVAALLDQLELPSCHLVGISFGGMIAQYVAHQHPQRILSLSLLATSPKFGLDGTVPEHWRAARLAPLDAGLQPSDFAEQVLRSIAGPYITATAMAEQQAAMNRVTAAGLRQAVECLITHDSRSLLPMIATPTLCLVGEHDEETPVAYSQAIVDALPNAQLKIVPGGGHLLNAEEPAIVNQLLLQHALQAAAQ